MTKTKKLNKKKIIISLLLIFVIFTIALFARYMLNQFKDFYSKTTEFYFGSDKLAEHCPFYRIENWSGVDEYKIIINLNSNQNNILSAPYEIEYTVTFTNTDNVRCEIDKLTGIIPATTESDTFTMKVIPITQLNIGDIVNIKITANVDSPYEKEISADFQLVVGQEKVSYEIMDEFKQPYLDLNITNTISYYIVSESIDGYAVGEKIARDTYLKLSPLDQQKCYSSIITLQFNPEFVLLDMTDISYINAIQVNKTLKEGYQYISGITFKVDAITGTRVRFYKTDITQDYTYPNTSNLSIITVTSI